MATRTDPLLSRVYRYIIRGLPCKVEESLNLYLVKKSELTVEGGCVLWGIRVVIPDRWREKLLLELHKNHPEIYMQDEEYCKKVHVGARNGL